MTREAIVLNAETVRAICLEEGADDAGFVDSERAALGAEREEIRMVLPGVRSIISICCRVNPESMRAPPRHYANDETRRVIHDITDVARRILARLRDEQGVRGLVPPVSFPMDTSRWPAKMWEVSHKPIAVQAGLGHMGVHRSVIHPKLGSYILLESILIDAVIDRYHQPLETSPCTNCMLCVMACPVGAISATAPFDVNACVTHNYREFLSGFQDWVDDLTNSENAAVYRRNVGEPETLSWWQSLAHGPNYKSSYCIAVCPAGTDNIGPFREAPRDYLERVVQPLTERRELVYVMPGSAAEKAVARHPNKQVRHVRSPRHLRREAGCVILQRFSRLKADNITVRPFMMNLEFTGKEPMDVHLNAMPAWIAVTYRFRNETPSMLRVDSETFLVVFGSPNAGGFVAGFAWALLRGRFRYRGKSGVLLSFLRVSLRVLGPSPVMGSV